MTMVFIGLVVMMIIMYRRIGKLEISVDRLRKQMAQRDTAARMPEAQESPAPAVDASFSEVPRYEEPTVPPLEKAPGHNSALRGRVMSLLSQLRANWMIWLGGLCIALAGIFLVKYSIDSGLLGPTARIVVACLIGLALHGAAEWLRRKTGERHPAFAALAGGASIMLFSAILAALHLYQLLAPGLAFMLLAAIALATMALALVHGPVLAIIGILGAYVVPILVSNDQGDILSALIYSLIISGAALLLMRYVYRPWLWCGMLAGGLGWWLISFANIEATGLRGYYLAVLAYGMLAIPAFDWKLVKPDGEHGIFGANSDGMVRFNLGYIKPIELPLITVSLILVALAQAISIAHDGFSPNALLQWSPLVIIMLLAGRQRSSIAVLPWVTLATQWFGWLYCGLVLVRGHWQLQALDPAVQQEFLWFALGMTALYSGLNLVLGRGRPYRHLRSSLIAMAPVCWLALAYLLVTDLSTVWDWSLISLVLGVLYIALAQHKLRRDATVAGAVWLLLAGHLGYSLAVAMFFREATLTLALATQLVSLAWLIRRFELKNLDWLVKAVLALVVARLTFNPWLMSYPVDVHWSLWTYGGATLCCIIASRLVAPTAALRPWLEAVSLQLFILFVAAETRYQLYDGDIFRHQYSLVEAGINTALWSGLALVYHYRARVSELLSRYYTMASNVLMIMALVNYQLVLTWLNPLWGGDGVGTTPIFNVLLLAYGAPPLIAAIAYRVYEKDLRPIAGMIAAAGLLIFVSMEIRHLWQGALDIALPTRDGELYTYSAVWLVFAVAAILYASQRKLELLYKGGMALLIVVIAKLFLIDMAGLEGLWRVASFMGLGLSLLGLAYLYQRITGLSGDSGQAQ
jgi:uncharacterized membrane protein